MTLLLRVARRPLTARSLAPITTALYRPTRPHDDDTEEPEKLSHAERLALLPATLAAFKARHDHYIMIHNFTVPTEDDADIQPQYPEAARGLRLGTTLYYLLVNAKSRRKHSHCNTLQALVDMGFPVDVDWKQYVWEHQRRAALRVYRELHGDLLVPYAFVVPTGNAAWPVETWGFKLGHYVSNVKRAYHRRFPQKQLDDLDEMEASWELKELTFAERLALLAPTLEVFRAQHGHFLMPYHFVVPKEEDDNSRHEGDAWPAKALGEGIGATLHAFMTGKSLRDNNPDVAQALADIGFPVDVDWKQYVWDHQGYPAFRVYRALHGHCRVPRSFVVPSGDTNWPKETWGLKLGRYVENLRMRDHRSHTQVQLDQLDALGFWWGRQDRRRLKDATLAGGGP